MNIRCTNLRRRSIAIVTAVAVVLPSVQHVLLAQAQPAPATAASQSPPVDGGWPREYVTAAQARMSIYQPQVASWDGRKRMVAYAAVSYQQPSAAKPTLGTVKIESDTAVSVEERLVRFASIHVTETNFGSLARDQVQDLLAAVENGIPDGERVIALDRVLVNVDQSQILPKNVEGVKADPPVIFYSPKSAVLVNIDGEPVWSPIQNNDLKFAVNTNWDLFQHEPSKTYYLRHERVWLKASDIKGPWTAAGKKLPESFSKLPADENWKEVKASLPGASTKSIPTVFVSTTPAELILLRGEPEYIAVSGTRLLWVSNTENDIFRLGKTGTVYFLVSGRWFSAPGFTGPWTFATLNLPEDFKKITLEHPRSRVLASVPGTPEAAEAVLIAQVPQTARVNKKQVKAPEVAYQGEPKYEPIEKTTVSRAVNTDKDIIKVGDLYYMCFQGVWFMGRSPTGPWEATGSVPGQIYEIPASSPAHNVTYVTVEDDDDEWVTFAAVAGYTGMMIAWGCAVWGSGWYYPPYVGYGGFYPVYYPHHYSYGAGAWYNPWTGGYGRGAVAYGPYGGAGVAARYNPTTGTYSRSAAAWGPGGARGAAEAYNPRTGTYARTQQGAGVYGSWGSTAVQRGDQWAQTSRVTNRATGTTTRATQGSGGGGAVTRRGPEGSGGVARTGSGDVYAGHDGNVYRREDGSWQKYDDGSWGSVERPEGGAGAGTADRAGATNRGATATTADRGTPSRTPSTSDTMRQLDRDRAARAEGTTRTRDLNTARSGGAARSGGSYRPSGGMRAGGGRRR
jgi:hypothetical protein